MEPNVLMLCPVHWKSAVTMKPALKEQQRIPNCIKSALVLIRNLFCFVLSSREDILKRNLHKKTKPKSQRQFSGDAVTEESSAWVYTTGRTGTPLSSRGWCEEMKYGTELLLFWRGHM